MRAMAAILTLLATTASASAQYWNGYGYGNYYGGNSGYRGGYGDIYSEYRRYRDYRSSYPSGGRGWSNVYQNYYGPARPRVPRYRYDFSWGGGDRGYLGGRGGGWGGEW